MAKEPINFKCVTCGTEFIQKRKDNVTCTTLCTQRLWQKNNPEKYKERHKKRKPYYKVNPENFRKIQNRYKHNRRKTDLNYYLYERMSNAIRDGLKGNKGFKKWVVLVGYTIDDLKNHLETTLPNITWNEYLVGDYHIDHIIPQSLYNYEHPTDKEFLKCWDYRNLRIISGSDNLSKLAKLDMVLVEQYGISDLLPTK